MKKLLFSAILALAAFNVSATPSFAGTFGLFPHCGCCCSCGAKFCVRQYNAFSPVCSGTIYCDGIMPIASGLANGGCANGMCGGGGASALNYYGFMNGPGCQDGSCLGSLPASEEAMPGTDTPPANNPIATPSPLPNQMPAGQTSQVSGNQPIHNTAYRPIYVPVSNPARMQGQPQPMVAPSYWGN
jgi:hypothetical protein